MAEPNLHQWAAFVTVVDEGTITRAAARLRVAQPSLSQLLRALERQLGTPLLDRLPRSVVPTPAGRVLYTEARAVLQAAAGVERAVRAAAGGDGGELRIGTVASLAVWLIPAAAPLWRARRPAAMLGVVEFPTRRGLEEAATAGAVDLAIGPRPRRWSGTLTELGSEPYVALLPADDPLLGAGPIRLAALADRPWVGYAPGHGLSGVVERACAEAGFAPRVDVVTGQVDAAVRLAAAGLGVALVPLPSVPAALRPQTVQLRRAPHQPLAAYAAGPWNPLSAAFVDVVAGTPLGLLPPPRRAVGSRRT
jgi:DNA-binding transcriptional LysR family regulator